MVEEAIVQAPPYDRHSIRQALARLKIDRLVLAVHDASFPGTDGEDLGRGSPYSRGGRAFIRFGHELGFDTVQLGPQGQTSRINPSPYDGTTFSRSLLSLAPGPLVEPPFSLISSDHLERLVRAAPVFHGGAASDRVDHAHAFNGAQGLLDGAFAAYQRGDPKGKDLRQAFGAYLDENLRPGSWLERDAVFAVLSDVHQSDDWRRWPQADRQVYAGGSEVGRKRAQGLLATGAHVAERYALGQFLLQVQHDELRAEAASLGLELFGDLQVGYAHQDLWAYGDVFLSTYRMGAPPSRTNPEGQPWGYPVLNPDLYGEPPERLGPALALLSRRVDKLLSDFDGMRIDHPHGLVCPWVYRADARDAFEAVRSGARLFDSPQLPDHPELAAFAIVRPDQINPNPHTERHADDWVVDLEEAQIERYGRALDLILERARRHGRKTDAIQCEVLSTWPRPLREVMQRRQLGRFCVTQKANPRVPDDVYRSEHLTERDWIMVGNHDTPPLRAVVASWQGTPHLEVRAHHLASRLVRSVGRRAGFARDLIQDPRRFCDAMFAELFSSRARHVSVFFADLLGLTETYNRPGVQDERNWTLRVPPDYLRRYESAAPAGAALDLRRALALALRAKGESADDLALADRLDRAAGPLPPAG